MSTGLECDIVTVKGLGTFYILQSPFCHVSCWDWREEDPSVGGPYRDEDEAYGQLRRRHGNPGGYSAFDVSLARAHQDKTLRKNLERALKRPLPPLTFSPKGEEMAWELMNCGMFGNGQHIWAATSDETGIVHIEERSSWRREDAVLSHGSVSMIVTPDAVRLTFEHDPHMSKTFIANIVEGAKKSVGHWMPHHSLVTEITPRRALPAV